MPKCPNTNTRSASNSTATRTSKDFQFFVGSDNGGEPAGLRAFGIDCESGAINEVARADAQSPIYLALSKDGRFLYAAQRADGALPGAVASYAVNADGSLRFINEIPCAPSVPCHISLSENPAGRYLFFAEYSYGTAGVLRIRESDGALEKLTCALEHSGALGPNKSRQDRPHCHCIVQAADGFVFVCDLGLDKVVAYSFDSRDGILRHCESDFQSVAGSGPRHMIFNADNTRAYLLNELDSTLTALDYSGGGVLRASQTLSTLPPDFAGETKAAAVKISPCGKWVLASNRGHDSIAAFRIGATLNAPIISKLGGRFPRDFEFAPDGNFVIVGHKLSDEFAVYRFDSDSGALTQTENAFKMRKPLCFVNG